MTIPYRCRYALISASLTVLTACSSTPEVKKAEAPVEPISGRGALYRMYQMARSSWSRDALVVRMASTRVPGTPDPPPGLSLAWEAVFAAAGRARGYTYSELELLPDLHKGSFAGPSQNLNGTPFLIEAVKVDSDAAYKTALAKVSKEAQKLEGKPVLIMLDQISKYPAPAWRIVWGESTATAALSVYVDAMTGAYLETIH